jgi:HTH-type transcriptional regulator/antitoxin HigA
MRTTSIARLPAAFAELCALHPPRPIHDDVDYENTAELVDQLSLQEKRTRDQDEYLETLTILIEKYDAEDFIRTQNGSPLKRLKNLLANHDMSASDLGRLLGNRSLGGAILRGDRKISKAHAIALGAYFKLSPAAFL